MSAEIPIRNSFRSQQVSTNQRTELRLRLLSNGYTPLPNVLKRPGIPAWQKIQPDEAMIRTWDRQHKTLTTGIRLENGLIAFDFDIDDPAVEGADRPHTKNR